MNKSKQGVISGTWSYFPNSKMFKIDNKFAGILGISLEEDNQVPQEQLEKLIHPGDIFELSCNLLHSFRNNELEFNSEFRIKPIKVNDQNWHWIYAHGAIVMDENTNGLNKKLIGSYIDITHYKKTEDEALQSKRYMELIFENVPSGIFTVDKNKRITSWNKKAAKITGYLPHEVIGKECRLFSIEPCKETCNMFNEKVQKPILNKECKIKSKEGKLIHIKKNLNQVKDLNNEVIGGVESFEDITQLKMYESKILNAMINAEEKERRRVSRELHDGLGSLLSGIKIYVNMLKMPGIDEQQNEEIFVKINNLINEAIKNTRDVANNIQPGTLTDFGIIASLESYFNELNHDMSIKIHFFYDEVIEQALDNQEQMNIYRIIQELVNNTLKYSGAENIFVNLYQENENILIQYKDDGCGFQKSIEELQAKGSGITNIISRVKMMNAEYSMKNNIEKGIFVSIKIIQSDYE